MDPAEAAEVEVVLGAGDGDVGQAGFSGVDGGGKGVAVEVGVVGVFGFGEVVGDADGGPFAAFGLVDGGDGGVGVGLGTDRVCGQRCLAWTRRSTARGAVRWKSLSRTQVGVTSMRTIES
jgi:hypothetical protein